MHKPNKARRFVMRRKNRKTSRTVQNTVPMVKETKIEEIAVTEEKKIEEPVINEKIETEIVRAIDSKDSESDNKKSKVEEAPISEEPVKKTRTRKTVKKEDAAEKAETPAKKTVRRTRKATVHHFIQFAGCEISADELDERVKTDYKEKTGAVATGEICVYIKPEESVAYYTINGEGAPEFKISL